MAIGGRETARADTIREENEKPGTTDWLMTNTRVDPATKYRCPWIEGYCSRTSVRAGETIEFKVSTNPASQVSRSTSIAWATTAAKAAGTWTRLGPLQGLAAARSAGRRRAAARVPLGNGAAADDPHRLAERRLSRQAHRTAREAAKLRDLHRARRPRSAISCFSAPTRPGPRTTAGPTSGRSTTTARRRTTGTPGRACASASTGPTAGTARSSTRRCRKARASFCCGSFRWRSGWSSTATTCRTSPTSTRTPIGEGLLRGKAFLSVGHDEYWSLDMYRPREERDRARRSRGVLQRQLGRWRDRDAAQRGRRAAIARSTASASSAGATETRTAASQSRGSSTGPIPALLMGARTTDPANGGADWTCVNEKHWLFEGTGMKNGDSIKGLVGWEHHGHPAADPGTRSARSRPGLPAAAGRKTWSTRRRFIQAPKGNWVFNAATIWWSDGLSAPPGYLRPPRTAARRRGRTRACSG